MGARPRTYSKLRLAITEPSPGVTLCLWIYFTIDDEDYCTLRAVRRATPQIVDMDD
jgi:hypothetical protein